MFKCFPEELNKEISEKFKEPCELLYSFLCEKYPDQLLKLINSGELKNTDLTFALQHAGYIKSPNALDTIIDYLDIAEDRLILEGAILGVKNWYYTNIYQDIPRKLKCLNCDWRGTYEEADFGVACGDGCCHDHFCPKCGGPLADEDYSGEQ